MLALPVIVIVVQIDAYIGQVKVNPAPYNAISDFLTFVAKDDNFPWIHLSCLNLTLSDQHLKLQIRLHKGAAVSFIHFFN